MPLLYFNISSQHDVLLGLYYRLTIRAGYIGLSCEIERDFLWWAVLDSNQ
jgi:hypothetical protein